MHGAISYSSFTIGHEYILLKETIKGFKVGLFKRFFQQSGYPNGGERCIIRGSC